MGNRYMPPAESDIAERYLSELVPEGRTLSPQEMLRLDKLHPEIGPTLYCVGDLELLKRPAIAIVGSRQPSKNGAKRARQLTTGLVQHGIVIVSGLARGIDSEAHKAAIEADGRTVGVIGTPLDQATPVSSAPLQEIIYKDHLLVSPFPLGAPVYRSNFPARNKVMAALTDATVIIEAGETSGTLHQAVECARLNRPLLIPASLIEEHKQEWPERFLRDDKAKIFRKVEEVIAAITS